MSAFFSGTDNNDDKNNIGFSGVIGKMNQASPMTVWRFNYKDKKIDCSFDDIFAVPARPAQESNPEWMERVVVYTPPPARNWTHPQSAPYSSGKAPGSSQATVGRTYHPQDREGVREGPHLRGTFPEGRFPTAEFLGDMWAMGDEYDFLLPSGYADERFARAERSLSHVTEDPLVGGTHLGERESEGGNGRNINGAANEPSLVEDGQFDLGYREGDDRFDELIINHGEDVANVFCFIDDTMHVLNGKDDLNKDLMTDMFHLMSEEGQANFFKSLYHELPNKVQEEIQTSGF
jgi:hypothetical protein